MTAPVYIHAGAHRTGTSSFQMCLAHNRAALTALGYDLAYPGRDGIPEANLRLRLPGPRHGPRQCAEIATITRQGLDQVRSGPDRPLILSEENIPGRMYHFYQGRFYPASAKRLTALANALETPPAHLIYVVRPYGELFVSAYRKRAEDNAVDPFDTIVPRLMAMDRGWPQLLAEMRDLLAPAQMTVLPYAKRGESRAVLRRLVPDLAGVDLEEPQITVNRSATDAALEALQAHHRAGETLTRPEWQRIVAEHAERRDATGFAALPASERAVLDQRYSDDLDRIAAMPGVTLI